MPEEKTGRRIETKLHTTAIQLDATKVQKLNTQSFATRMLVSGEEQGSSGIGCCRQDVIASLMEAESTLLALPQGRSISGAAWHVKTDKGNSN